MIAYHVTTLDNYNSIFKNGLIPNIGPRSESFGELIPRIYLFPDKTTCYDALSGWLGDEFDEDDELMILQLDIKGFKTTSDVDYELAISEFIPANRILNTYNELEFVESIKNDEKQQKKNRIKINI